MKAKKIVYLIGAVICATLTIIFRTAALPVALAYAALDAMGRRAEGISDNILEKIKG